MDAVRSYLFLLILACALPWHASADDVSIQAEIDQYQAYQNIPVKVLITVSHRTNQAVDVNSFSMQGKPIHVELVQNVRMTAEGNLVLSIYNYNLPPQPVGLRLLPSIQVTVGGKAYNTTPITYEVKAMKPGQAPPAAAPPSAAPAQQPSQPGPPSFAPEPFQGAFLRLEALVDGPTTLYPGQKTILEYKYSFNVNVDTTKEVTPMVEAKGLIKIGDLITEKKQEGQVSVLEVFRKVQAGAPGTYVYGPSSIAGYAYEERPGGGKVYHKPELSSTAPAVTITVLPFSAKGKPASFNGAVGTFAFKVRLLSSPNVNAGDEMSLSVEISGKDNLDIVQLPELCCQPGMSGNFRLSDLPPVGKIEGDTKRFLVHMRPLSVLIKEIPSLEFSYFDPVDKKYVVLHSDPIPITVKPLMAAPPAKEAAPEKQAVPAGGWKNALKQTGPIEIASIYDLSAVDLYNKIFGTWWALLVIPFGIGFLIFQINLMGYAAKAKQRSRQKHSADYFAEALAAPSGSAMLYALLNKAFLMRLAERGELPSAEADVHKLPREGVPGEVRAFLTEVEELRYRGVKYDEKQMLEKAGQLFTKIASRK